MNDLLLKTLNMKNDSRPPVWFMRQAGRYMPKYRALREKYSFHEMTHTPEIATEVTLMPIEELGVDAAILFSDILFIAETLGKKFHFKEGVGPILEESISKNSDIENLLSLDVNEKMHFVSETIRMVKPKLNVPLIGFCGGPFTVASYMLKEERIPESFEILLEKITEKTIDYINMQIEAGVDAIQIFDTWAGNLNRELFENFCLKFIRKILAEIKNIPTIFFCKNSSQFLDELSMLNLNCISLDSNCNISQVREKLPNLALQGNLEPKILLEPQKIIAKQTDKILKCMHKDKGFIFNLSHGILKETPMENVKFLTEYVRERA